MIKPTLASLKDSTGETEGPKARLRIVESEEVMLHNRNKKVRGH